MRARRASTGASAAIRATLPVTAAVVLALVAAACSFRPEKVGSSLPPLTVATTTTTVLPTSSTEPRFYEVKSGDSVSSIADAFGVSQQELIALNGIANPDQIQAGQRLQLPPSTVVVTAPGTETTPPANPPESGPPAS